MPNLGQHISNAQHNEKFFNEFDLDSTPYRDWVVVGIFYSALHYIDSYLATIGKHPHAHGPVIRRGTRDFYLKADNNLFPIYKDYRDLKEFRRDASYTDRPFRAGQIRNDILPLLSSIKSHLRRLVPNIA